MRLGISVQLAHEITATQAQLLRAQAKLKGALKRKDDFRMEARTLAAELVHAQQDTHSAKGAAVAKLQAQVCSHSL